MRLLRTAVLSLALLTLTACEPRLEVELASANEALPWPGFKVTEPDRDRPRFTTVQVLRVEDRALVWHMRAEPYGDQASTAWVTYGRIPAGFAEVVPAEKLKPGVTYVVVVSGVGRGQLRFSAESTGQVIARE